MAVSIESYRQRGSKKRVASRVSGRFETREADGEGRDEGQRMSIFRESRTDRQGGGGMREGERERGWERMEGDGQKSDRNEDSEGASGIEVEG